MFVRAAIITVVVARAIWVAWRYYFGGAPRYPLESAAVALIVVGAIVVLLRPASRHEGEGARDRREHLPVVALLAFVVGGLALYAPALGIGLLSDDYVLRDAARAGDSVTGAGGFFRPLPLLVWRTVLAVTDSPMPLHALNVALHGLNASLVALLGVRLGLTRNAALAGGALFLIFPAAPEAVAWASGIQDVLMTSAALGAVLVAGAPEMSAPRMAAVALLFVAALATKETSICVPALIAICWMTPARAAPRRLWIVFAGLAAVAAAYAVFRASIGIRTGFLVEPSRFLAKHVAVTAFGSLAVPWRSPASAAAAWLAFATTGAIATCVAFAALIWRRGDDRFVRAIRLTLWVVAAVAPVYSYFYVNTQLEGARYLYLAECGWALLVADIVWTITGEGPAARLMRSAIVAVALFACAFTLERELAFWRRAADLRDQVLTLARASAREHGCAAAAFSKVPDSLDGAYVFRNGFHEALGNDDAAGAPVGCRFEWQGSAFVPAR